MYNSSKISVAVKKCASCQLCNHKKRGCNFKNLYIYCAFHVTLLIACDKKHRKGGFH